MAHVAMLICQGITALVETALVGASIGGVELCAAGGFGLQPLTPWGDALCAGWGGGLPAQPIEGRRRGGRQAMRATGRCSSGDDGPRVSDDRGATARCLPDSD